MKIIRGPVHSPKKVMIYSLPGAGKTTLADSIENSLLIDIEGGASENKCAKTSRIKTADEFFSVIVELIKTPEREFDFVIIDTADWLMRLIINEVAEIGKNSLDKTLNKSNGGYGNGKQVLDNHVRVKLLPALAMLIDKGYGVVLLAHAEMKTLMDADGVDVEKISPKIDPTTLSAFVEWCDAIYYLKTDDDGNRTIRVSSTSDITAKNRFGLQGEYELAKTNIMDLLDKKGDE